MEIREAKVTDYPAILDLHIDSIKALCSGYYSKKCISQWAGTRRLEQYKNIPGVEVLIVGEDHAKIIGFSRLKIQEQCITGLFVAPGQTGKNYGKQLLTKIEDIAKKYAIGEWHLSSRQPYLNQS